MHCGVKLQEYPICHCSIQPILIVCKQSAKKEKKNMHQYIDLGLEFTKIFYCSLGKIVQKYTIPNSFKLFLNFIPKQIYQRIGFIRADIMRRGPLMFCKLSRFLNFVNQTIGSDFMALFLSKISLWIYYSTPIFSSHRLADSQ